MAQQLLPIRQKRFAIAKAAAMVVLATSILICTPRAEAGDCSAGNDPTCAYVPMGTSAPITPKVFTPDPACEQVTNVTCPDEIMVPMESPEEWNSFNDAVSNNTYYGGIFQGGTTSCAIPAPCQTLKVALTASPTTVLAGGTSPTTLSWTITGATGKVTCTTSSTDNPSTWPKSSYSYRSIPATTPTGTASVMPDPPSNTDSTTYTLTCSDSLQNNVSDAVTITVAKPLVVTLSADPPSVAPGYATTLSYSVTDASNLAFQCAASATDNDSVWIGSQYVDAGSSVPATQIAVTPAPQNTPGNQNATSVTYYLNCSDTLQNNVQQSATVSLHCPTGYTGTWPNCQGPPVTVASGACGLASNPLPTLTCDSSGTSCGYSWTATFQPCCINGMGQQITWRIAEKVPAGITCQPPTSFQVICDGITGICHPFTDEGTSTITCTGAPNSFAGQYIPQLTFTSTPLASCK